jgi:hypothetical protein
LKATFEKNGMLDFKKLIADGMVKIRMDKNSFFVVPSFNISKSSEDDGIIIISG